MDQSTGRLYSIVFCARQLLMHVITEDVAPADINTHPTTCCSISLAIRMKTHNDLFGSVQIIVWHCNRSSEVSAYCSMRSTTNGTAMSLIMTVRKRNSYTQRDQEGTVQSLLSVYRFSTLTTRHPIHMRL